MKRSLPRPPKWYPLSLIVGYVLPLLALPVYTVATLLKFDLVTLIVAFLGTFLMGFILFLPIGGMYYAALSLLHTLLDELCFSSAPKKMRLASILRALVCSSFLMVTSILTLQKAEHELGWIPIVLMLIGFVFVFARLAAQIIVRIFPKKKTDR